MTHPYFVAKARAALAANGIDPNSYLPLASWAEQAKLHSLRQLGVIVDAGGQIVAKTEQRGTAIHIEESSANRLGFGVRDVGSVMARLRQVTGRHHAHFCFGQLCVGEPAAVRPHSIHQ